MTRTGCTRNRRGGRGILVLGSGAGGKLLAWHMARKDFASGAMIESVVRRAKKLALKRYIGGAAKGLTTDDLLAAVREEFKENEDLKGGHRGG